MTFVEQHSLANTRLPSFITSMTGIGNICPVALLTVRSFQSLVEEETNDINQELEGDDNVVEKQV